MKYQKKPVVIEAVQMHYAEIVAGHKLENDLFDEIPDWLRNAIESGRIRLSSRDARDYAVLGIDTPEGTMECSPGDWIIRGVKGEVYPCKDEIFKLTYEPVEEA